VTRVPYVEVIDRSKALEWDAYVEGHPGATLYHLHAWRTIGERAYEIEAPFLCARDQRDGPIRGVLPLFRMPRPFSPYLTTGLFGAYGEVLADSERHATSLVAAAMKRIDEREADFLHLKLLGESPLSQALEPQNLWVTAHLDLKKSVDDLWRGLARKMRWKVRRAQRGGLRCLRGRDWVDAFYEVLSTNMLRKGAPIYGRKFFHAMLEALGPRAEIVALGKDGHVVSGAAIAWFRGVMYVPFASALPSVFSHCPNNLLYWEVMRWAHELGLHTLDFGASMRGSGGLEFKRSWHPRMIPVATYLYARDLSRAIIDPGDSFVARNTVRLWTRLPPRLAEVFGPAVCRWIA